MYSEDTPENPNPSPTPNPDPSLETNLSFEVRLTTQPQTFNSLCRAAWGLRWWKREANAELEGTCTVLVTKYRKNFNIALDIRVNL